jgi:hypothetical protein
MGPGRSIAARECTAYSQMSCEGLGHREHCVATDVPGGCRRLPCEGAVWISGTADEMDPETEASGNLVRSVTG